MSALPTGVEKIRRQLREKSPPGKLSGVAHLRLLSFYLLFGIALCLYLTRDISWVESLTVPVTFVYFNLAEYWGHRVPMHRPVPFVTLIFRGHTLQHHLFFTHAAMECESSTDFRFLLLPPYMILFFALLFIAPAAAALFFLLSPNIAYLFAATAAAYYLSYELMHAAYHLPRSHWVSQLALIRSLRGSHQRHHNHEFMHCNFNITFPIGDLLFGTRFRGRRGAVIDEGGL